MITHKAGHCTGFIYSILFLLAACAQPRQDESELKDSVKSPVSILAISSDSIIDLATPSERQYFDSINTLLFNARIDTENLRAYPVAALRAILEHEKYLSQYRSINKEYDLPPGAKITEYRELEKRNEAIIIWFEKPVLNPFTSDSSESYTSFYGCAGEVLGSYMRGPAHLSLLDTKNKKLINSLMITGRDPWGENNSRELINISLPYHFRPGSRYYDVPGPLNSMREAKPVIIDLKDLNSDGEAYEFVLYDRDGCDGYYQTIIGISSAGKIIQYPFKMSITDSCENRGSKTETTLYWISGMDFRLHDKKEQWHYYHPVSGTWLCSEEYTVKFDKRKDAYTGTMTWRNY